MVIQVICDIGGFSTRQPILSIGAHPSLCSILQSCILKAKVSGFRQASRCLVYPLLGSATRPREVIVFIDTRPSTAARYYIAEIDSMPNLRDLELPKALLNRCTIHADN